MISQQPEISAGNVFFNLHNEWTSTRPRFLLSHPRSISCAEISHKW